MIRAWASPIRPQSSAADAEHGGPARRPAGSVDARDSVRRDAEVVAEGRARGLRGAELLLGHDGEGAEVREGPERVGGDARSLPLAPVEGASLPRVPRPARGASRGSAPRAPRASRTRPRAASTPRRAAVGSAESYRGGQTVRSTPRSRRIASRSRTLMSPRSPTFEEPGLPRRVSRPGPSRPARGPGRRVPPAASPGERPPPRRSREARAGPRPGSPRRRPPARPRRRSTAGAR